MNTVRKINPAAAQPVGPAPHRSTGVGERVSISPPAIAWSICTGCATFISTTSRRGCRARREHFLINPFGMMYEEITASLADQDRSPGQHHRQFESGLHDQLAGLRHPQRDPRRASRRRLRPAHAHQCRHGGIDAQMRVAAADADRDALVADRLSRFRRRGRRSRRAEAARRQSRRQRGHDPAQSRPACGRADHRPGVQQHLSAGARLPDAIAGDGLQRRDFDAAARA